MKKLSIAMLAALFVASVAPNDASARTRPFMGKAESGSQQSCFSWSLSTGTFITGAAGCASGAYTAPINWDTPTPGDKVVLITGRQNAVGQITSCSARTYDAGGFFVQSANFPAILANGAFQTVGVTLTNVPPGGFTFVRCNLSNSAARLFRMDSFPS